MGKENIPEHVLKIIKLDDIHACRSYLRVVTDYLFDLSFALRDKGYHSIRMAESSIWVQMMFTNALAFSKLLEGMPYAKDGLWLNPIIDHRMIYSLGRTMYENLIAFELVYIIPSNDDEKQLMYCLYEAAGYKEQLEVLSDDLKARNPEKTKVIQDSLNAAISEAKATAFYQSANKQTQEVINNAFKSGRYRYVILPDKTLKKVEWDDGMKCMGIQSDIFDGMYKYFSNLSHPSHWGQLQFEQSFEKLQPEYINLACTATRFVLSFLSLFIVDFMKLVPEAKDVLNQQTYDNQQMIQFFNGIFRKK
ncbi:MAG: hypothetical protein ACI4C4_02170 [Lachnospiraceae bacterium]